MIETAANWIGALAPFLAPYPMWVKGAFAAVIFSAAIFFVGLVVAPTRPPATAEPGSGANTQAAWLEVRGVNAFGGLVGAKAKVTVIVNGTPYHYPSSLPGVDRLEIGSDMAPQRFQIPFLDRYDVRIEAEIDGMRFASVEEQSVDKQTVGIATYSLRKVLEGTRAAAISAEVKYVIFRR